MWCVNKRSNLSIYTDILCAYDALVTHSHPSPIDLFFSHSLGLLSFCQSFPECVIKLLKQQPFILSYIFKQTRFNSN